MKYIREYKEIDFNDWDEEEEEPNMGFHIGDNVFFVNSFGKKISVIPTMWDDDYYESDHLPYIIHGGVGVDYNESPRIVNVSEYSGKIYYIVRYKCYDGHKGYVQLGFTEDKLVKNN